MCDETDTLHLTNVVESDDTDPRLWVLLLALVEFLQHLSGVSAPEHGQLPHCPVSAIVVSGGAMVLTVDETVLQIITNRINKGILINSYNV